MRENQCHEISSSQSQEGFHHLAPSVPVSPKPRPSIVKKNPQEYSPLVKIPKQLNLVKESKPRLIIDKIVLENFKSYAGKQVIGPFHENFTSVVGPNGSGKSNLIESMLFIFGYKASWMRLNRLNQLIHNSSTMSGITRTAVEVQFKKIHEVEEGKFIQLMQSRFTIRRTVNTSNISKYYINGNDSTQGEIKDKLKSEGIDLNNNRFLILQGQVQQISQMKQKSGDRDKPGLLQYLEDIIGSSQYIDKIEQSITEFNKTEEIKHEKGQLMKIVETQLKSMNKGKQEAIKYVKKEKQLYQIQNILNQVIISNNKYESSQLNIKLQKLEREKERIISEEKEKLKKQGERIKQIKRLRMDIEMMQKKILRLDEDLNKLNIEDQNINQQVAFKSEDSVKYKKKIESFEQEMINIIKESDEIKKELPDNKKRKQILQKEIMELKEFLNHHDDTKFTKQIKKYENKLKEQEYELNIFNDKLKLARRNFDKKFVNTKNLEVRALQLENEVEESKEKLSLISEALSKANSLIEPFISDKEHLETEKRARRNQLQKVQMILREEQNENKERGMVNNMFEKIMEEKIPGVIGRLGDLGSVREKKYDQIITSCSSGRLDNIVVTNYDAAKAVTDYLKRTKIGRITCIILDIVSRQVGHFMDKRWENLPNSTRLFDMIDPVNEQVRVAFYFAISDTIYCQDSNMGMKYAMGDDRNRRRVVSKKHNGYIIYERNGMMLGCPQKRGGFDVKAKSKMRTQTNNKEIKDAEAQKRKLINELNNINLKVDEIVKKIKEIEEEIVIMKKQKVKMEGSIREQNQEIEDIKKSSLQNSKNFETEKAVKEKEIKSIEEELMNLREKCQQTEAQIMQIEQKRKKSQTSEISQKRQKYKQIRSEFQKIQKQIQKCEAILKNTKSRIEENKVQQQKSKKIMERLEKDLNKLKLQRQKIEKEATKIAGQQIGLQEKTEQSKKQEKRLQVLFQDDEKQVKESKKKIDQAKAEVQNCREQMKKYYDGIASAQAELERIRQTYKQLIATYDFMQDIEKIQQMKIDGIKYSQQNSLLESSVLLNQSMSFSMDKSNSAKVFPLEQLLATSPFDNLDEQEIDPFLLFHEKLVSFLVSETQALKKLTGSNLLIINEYREKYLDYKQKHDNFQAVVEKQRQLKQLIEDLKIKRLSIFKQGFMIINSKLKEVYQLLTRGGDAELQLIDSLDPFSQGINFSVRPPKKTWKEINKLSGGQKTLSSLSLIFALHYFKPTPLYFMDEIDAALDFKNVSIVADYIKKRTKDAQFIIISLRNNMFDLADKLIGVYKTFDQTKIVQFIPQKFKKVHKIGEQNMDNNILSN